MKQHEAVVEAMRRNGGYATLVTLYREATKVPGAHWGTRTPFASIRRIVQTRPEFFRIRPGLWGLVELRAEVEKALNAGQPGTAAQAEFDHTYYQGLAVELGNSRGCETTVPRQDANKRFLGKRLSEICSLDGCYDFSYPALVRRAGTVDVVWFNERRLPAAFIEIEFTTDFSNSLTKFVDFQDFRTKFAVVADAARKNQWQHRMQYSAYAPIRDCVRFVDFENLALMHATARATANGGL